MNLQTQLKALEAKAAKIKAKIARQVQRAAAKQAKQLAKLPAKHGFKSVAELIDALKELPKTQSRDKKPARKPAKTAKKRTRLDPEVKRKLVEDAMKPGADRKALAKKSGASLNSINTWVSQARSAKK